MRQHNLKVTGSLQINGENVISASELSTLSASINSKIEGLNPSQIGTGSYTASISPNGIFRVNASTIITGSLSVSSLSGSGINYLAYSGGVVTAISGTAAIKYNQEFTATLGQTTFTPSVGYITDLIDVFYNGTKLSETDYTASNGSTIVLSQGADLAGDIIEVAIYNPVSGVSNNTLRQQTTFTASAAQTTFAVNYTPGLLDVYFNGSRLSNEEYTANNGTSIILSEAATGGEIIDIFVYSYQVGAFSGIGGQGQAGQFAYFSSQNGISGSSVISISGSSIIAGGNIIPLESGSSDLGSLEKPFRHIYVGTGSIFLVDNSGQVTNTISAQSIVTTDTLASGTIDLTKSLPTGTVSGSSQVVGILSSLNTATASFTPRITNLETKSASVDISITNINSFTASNSNESLNLKTGSYATTGSNTFFGTQTYSGSVYIANDLIVQGSSSIQYISASSVSIGTNIVQLNTANPSVRFAGLTIIDSGSIGGSGSFLYDSVQDEFIFVHRGNGTNVTSSHFIMGPETFDNLGNESYLTCNRLTKGTGKEHLVDSSIFDNGTTVCVNGNLIGTGTACFAGTVCTSLLKVQTAGGSVEAIRHSNDVVNNWSIGTDASCNTLFQTFEAAKCLILSTGGSGAAKLLINGSGNVGIGCSVPGVSLTFGTTDAIKLPTGTTEQRPTGTAGLFRFNSTLGQPEWYDSIQSIWQTIKAPNFSVEYLVVAGGGGGGVWSENAGYITGYQGSDSIFSTITSTGGGGGRAYNQTTTRTSGGSGGGGAGGPDVGNRTAGTGTTSQGYSGGSGYDNNRGGGGGGAGAIGDAATSTTHGAGGIGVSSTITGTAIYYAGGGGGAGAYNTPAGGAGGNGGGGAGAAPGSGPATSGTANRGGGGGAADAYWGQSHGGGGAGGFRTNAGTSGGGASSEPFFTVKQGVTYSVTVGAGATAVGNAGSGGVSNKNTLAGAGGSGIVILKIPNMYIATFSAGLTTSLSTSVTGYNIYSVTAGTGTVTFT